jgi:hypothetical protein
MGAIQVLMRDQQLTNTKRWSKLRRSQRIELTVPVVVHRTPKEGPQFSERAQTLVVNAHGALMALADKVALRQRLLMQNIDSGEQKECRVVSNGNETIQRVEVEIHQEPTRAYCRCA